MLKKVKLNLRFIAKIYIVFLFLFTFRIEAQLNLSFFDTEAIEGYSNDMKVQINEIQTSNQKALVTMKVFNKGTVVEMGIFQYCSISQIARKYNYQYYTILDTKNLSTCTNCNWAFEYTVALMESESDLTNEKFKDLYNENYKYRIKDINEAAEFCGFLPISIENEEKSITYDNLQKCMYGKLKNTPFDKGLLGMIYEFSTLICCFFTRGTCYAK